MCFSITTFMTLYSSYLFTYLFTSLQAGTSFISFISLAFNRMASGSSKELINVKDSLRFCSFILLFFSLKLTSVVGRGYSNELLCYHY